MLNIFDDADIDSDDYFSLSSDSITDDSFASVPSLSQSLHTQFSDVSNNFNIVHINAQSIPGHINDMQASLDSKNIHGILVSETWLRPSLSSISFTLPGFRLIRNDRVGRPGGGVAIYLRSHIPYTVISTSPPGAPDHEGEHLFIEVLLSHTKILLGVFYSNSSSNIYFPYFQNILEDFVPSYSHSIIMGDFNTCLIKRNYRTFKLLDLIQSFSMHILPLSATHHSPNSTPSLLDLAIVSSPQHVTKHGQLPADFSYHDLIFLSYKVRPPKAKPTIIMQRNFSGIDQEKFMNDAKNIDWSHVLNADTIDEQVSSFNSTLTHLYDVHAPLRAIKIKHVPAPWLTDEIKLLKHKKAVARTKYKIHPSDYNKVRYVSLRNHCNRMCRDAQRRHIFKSVQDTDPAKVWKFLRSLGIGKSRHETIPKTLDINSLNQHFSAYHDMDATSKVNTLQYLASINPPPDIPLFEFRQFSPCDVKKSIISISSNAVGLDLISRNMIVPILDHLLPVLCHILNFSLSNASFPSLWKEAQVVPLPKKANPKSFSEYRPISILPFLSKVLERLVQSQLTFFLNRNNLFNPFQSGFRAGHSTVTALVKITDDIRLGMEKGQLTILTLLDFSNAFNSVDFDILLAILRSINISPSVINWFHSYLHGRRQRVRLEDSLSTWCDTSAGVPQGGVLSPLLFAIFINSISSHLTSFYHLYADDLQLYCQAPIGWLAEAVEEMNQDLHRISQWSKSYGLKVNPLKTQVIIIGSSRQTCLVDWDSLPPIIFDGITIPISETVKNLGITFDRCLSWGPQLVETSRKIFASAGSLRRLRNFLPITTKIALVQSLLLPILDYADVSYLDLTQDQLDKLERLQNLCIRFIFGLRKYDHVSKYRAKLKWLPIRLRRDMHILSLLYSILFNPSSPPYLLEQFHVRQNPKFRSSENLVISIPAHKTSFYGSSFAVRAVLLWNKLPTYIRRSQTIATFKNRVKDLYLSKSR